MKMSTRLTIIALVGIGVALVVLYLAGALK